MKKTIWTRNAELEHKRRGVYDFIVVMGGASLFDVHDYIARNQIDVGLELLPKQHAGIGYDADNMRFTVDADVVQRMREWNAYADKRVRDARRSTGLAAAEYNIRVNL